LVIGIVSVMIIYVLYCLSTDSFNYHNLAFWMNGLFIIILGGFSALFPDIDLKQSKISRIVTVFGILAVIYISFISVDYLRVPLSSSNIKLILIWLGEFITRIIIYSLAFIGLMTLIRPRHRGITHTLFFTGIYGAVIFILAHSFMLSVYGMVGYLSHLLADRCIKLI